MRLAAALIALAATGAACLGAEEPAPASDAISSATAALRSLKTNPGLPGADAQALPTIEPSAIIIPSATTPAPLTLPDSRRDPAAAAKAVQSGKGWLLEAMTKDGSTAPLSLPGGLLSPTSIPGADLPAPTRAGATSGVTDSLSSWLSPGEFSIVSSPADRSTGGSSASTALGGDFGGSILPAPASRPAPVLMLDARDNPFIQAMNAPTAMPRSPVAPTALPDTPIYRPIPEPVPAPVQSRTENPLQNDKRAEDQKYFPQLNRF